MPHVFGFASLVSRLSIEASLRRTLDPADGPHLARLVGVRRAWNVTARLTHRTDYTFTREDGTPWRGWITFLGLEDSPGRSVLGAYYAVTADELELLDAREIGYHRVDVSDRLEPLDPLPPGEPVEVYWPRADVIATSARVGAKRTIMARYLRLVDDAYRRLGPQLYAEHLRTMPDTAGCRIEEILATPTASGTYDRAIDPG